MAQPCPDPSAHQKDHKLSEQASTAALYVTQPERGLDPRENVLNTDGKLSSKSAATSLRYAKAQDLPSFPSVGIDTANSAGTAAMLAKDYKMKELWQPGMSAAGSRAALLAHKDGGKVDLWHPSASSDGNSAAKLAMQNKTLSPQLDYGYTKDGRSNALLAATKSQRAGRQRAGSTPVPRAAAYPDSANSSHNALNAATISHRASTKGHNPRDPDGWDSAAMQAARIQNIGDHLDPQMYTERPPVEIEKQEKRDQAALRASAISMAKQMYDLQNRAALKDAPTPPLDGKQFAAHVASPPVDIKQEALKYIHLQDAAHKLAQERLAKVDKNFEDMRYREYYGYGNTPRSRLSTRSFTRKRASSETAKDELDSDDEEQAQRVRSQMSHFNTALANVDAKKQQADRDQLLAIAQKRVQKSMQDMDEKVFQDTGKVSQSMMDEWEAKARKRATEDAEKREATRGKTHIGGGKYMDTSEIEAIAQARLQPTLNDINDNAEKRRARDEEIRMDRAEEERQRQAEKAREKENKDIEKRAKQEQKLAAREEKMAAKREKEERKAAEKEEKAEHDPAEHSHRRSILGMLSIRHKDRDSKKNTTTTASSTTTATPATTTAPATTEAKAAKATTTDHADVVAVPATTVPETTVADTSSIADNKTSSTTDRSALTPAVPSAKDTTLTSDAKSETASISNDTKGSKGIKGLFAKLVPRKSESNDDDVKDVPSAKVGSESAVVGSGVVADEQSKDVEPVTTPVVAATVTEPIWVPESTDTADSTASASAVVPTAEPLSPSSFKRRDADSDDADVSSLSSSGLEEEDIAEGRTGRIARALGFGKSKAKHDDPVRKSSEEASAAPAEKAVVKDNRDDDDDDDDTFEEARDTVDPALAPEPAFIPSKASAQHGRETKFQEEL